MAVSVSIFKPGRLTFVVTHTSRPPRLQLTNCHYFTIDGEYRYQSFAQDFGPFNEAVLFKFCRKLNLKLTNASLERKNIVLYTSNRDQQAKANTAFLIGAFCVLYLGLDPAYVDELLEPGGPYIPFRDACIGPSTFGITLLDCFLAVHQAARWRWLDFSTFNVERYEHYETVENGDLNWIVPGRFLAFCGPHSRTVTAHQGYPTHTPEFYHRYFKKHNITTVVRTNKPMYDSERFTNAGFIFHDIFFMDGTAPRTDLVLQFLDICKETFSKGGGIAVHCKAGLGRTGTLIACYLMKQYRLSAQMAMAWLRICRPGSVLGQQQSYLLAQQRWLWSLADTGQNELSSKEMKTISERVDTIDLTEKAVAAAVVAMSTTRTPVYARATATGEDVAPAQPKTFTSRAHVTTSTATAAGKTSTVAGKSSRHGGGGTRATSGCPTTNRTSRVADITTGTLPTLHSSAPVSRSSNLDSSGGPEDPFDFPTEAPQPQSAFDIYQPDLGISEVKTQGDFLREQKSVRQQEDDSKRTVHGSGSGGSGRAKKRTPPRAPSKGRIVEESLEPVPNIGSTLADCQKLQMEMQTQRGQNKSPVRVSPGKRPRVGIEPLTRSSKSGGGSMAEPLTCPRQSTSAASPYRLRTASGQRLYPLKAPR